MSRHHNGLGAGGTFLIGSRRNHAKLGRVGARPARCILDLFARKESLMVTSQEASR